MTREELRERLADLAHHQWSSWMEYLFSKGHFESQPTNPTLGKESPKGRVWIMPAWAVERWQRQMRTPYADLSPKEQDLDRKEADKFLEVFNDFLIDRIADQFEQLFNMLDQIAEGDG